MIKISMMMMKTTVRAPTVIPKGIILVIYISVQHIHLLRVNFFEWVYSPWYPQSTQMLLHHKKVGENAYKYAARRKHDNEPEVELLVGPVVGLPDDDPRA